MTLLSFFLLLANSANQLIKWNQWIKTVRGWNECKKVYCIKAKLALFLNVTLQGKRFSWQTYTLMDTRTLYRWTPRREDTHRDRTSKVCWTETRTHRLSVLQGKGDKDRRTGTHGQTLGWIKDSPTERQGQGQADEDNFTRTKGLTHGHRHGQGRTRGQGQSQWRTDTRIHTEGSDGHMDGQGHGQKQANKDKEDSPPQATPLDTRRC